LLAEGILDEVPSVDVLGEVNMLRFTYNKVWDYFLSLQFLPHGSSPDNKLKGLIADPYWQAENMGILQVFAVRFPEEGLGEILDVPGVSGTPYNLVQAYIASIPWRTESSCSMRTLELFEYLCARPIWTQSMAHILPLAANKDHPWNAHWLHRRLEQMSLGDRDRSWTLWLNQQFRWVRENDPPFLLIRLAEQCEMKLLSDEQRYLLATVLSWMLSTTAVRWRDRISFALARVLRSDSALPSMVIRRFCTVNDPYVFERTLFAAASAAVHAPANDKGLRDLACVVHKLVFDSEVVQPNVVVRHYASIICEEAQKKKVLDSCINFASFRPIFRSKWPLIWSEQQEQSLEAEFNSDWNRMRPLGELISSTRTEGMGMYGDWGRYTMGSMVHNFQDRRLDEEPSRDRFQSSFDDRIARRYVLQRVIELGLDKSSPDTVPGARYEGRERPSIERLGKKYQWIALHEFLGFLSDHYHLRSDYDDEVRGFESARIFYSLHLLDPFNWRTEEVRDRDDWDFTPKNEPWWVNYRPPFSLPFSTRRRDRWIVDARTDKPDSLFMSSDGADEWITLSGYFRWKEPVPCFTRGKWMSAPYAMQIWMLNSYAVPETLVTHFVNAMKKPLLDHSYMPNHPDFRSDISKLVRFPKDPDNWSEWCERTFAGTPGAWFTTCNFSDDQDEDQSLHGDIPSPQLAHMLRLTWLQKGLKFSGARSSQIVVDELRYEEDKACLCRAGLLRTRLKARRLRLVWRIYGFKWVCNYDDSPRRDYWALYTLKSSCEPECICGGSWSAGQNARVERLPWQTGAPKH
jgi:hypothetical protein